MSNPLAVVDPELLEARRELREALEETRRETAKLVDVTRRLRESQDVSALARRAVEAAKKKTDDPDR